MNYKSQEIGTPVPYKQQGFKRNQIVKICNRYVTLDTILSSKLDKWVGSSLWRTPLAADSWTEFDDLLLSRRLSRDCIASDSCTDSEDDEHRNKVRIRNAKKQFKLHPIFCFKFGFLILRGKYLSFFLLIL